MAVTNRYLWHWQLQTVTYHPGSYKPLSIALAVTNRIYRPGSCKPLPPVRGWESRIGPAICTGTGVPRS